MKEKKIVKNEVRFLRVSIVIQTLPYKGMCGPLVDQIRKLPKKYILLGLTRPIQNLILKED